MHRSRPFVLVILAAAAACSKRDSSEGNDLLSQDRTLVARIQNDNAPMPGSCGTTTVAAAPTAAHEQQAEELTRQAGVAEMHGDIQQARSLLRRASDLDATNKSAAYHLGRTSEALGDRSSAMTAYCRYLALAPTAAESTEARQRMTALSRTMPRTTASVSDTVAARPNVAATTARSTTPPVATASVAQQPSPAVASRPVASTTVASRGTARIASRTTARRSKAAASSTIVTESPSVVASGEVRQQAPSEASTSTSTETTTSTESNGASGSATAGGDVVATPAPAPTDPAPMPPRAQRRGSIGVQSSILGAAAGAILGAATGRSVKSAVIGAAAGGVLGTVVGTATRPVGREGGWRGS